MHQKANKAGGTPFAHQNLMDRYHRHAEWVTPTMKQIRDECELSQRVDRAKGLLLVNFWADWSIPCHNMSTMMSAIAAALSDEDAVAFIDYHHQPKLAKNLGVYGVPTLIIYAGGREIARFSGVMSVASLRLHIESVKQHRVDQRSSNNIGHRK